MTKLQTKNDNFSSFMEIQNIPELGPIAKLIYENNKEAIINLINSSADIKTIINTRDSTEDSYSWTPLYWGVKFRRTEIINILLEYGADINQVVNDTMECCGTPLDLATLREDQEIIDLLQSFAKDQDIATSQNYQNIRTKPKGKEKRSFNYDYYSKKNLPGMSK